MNDMRRIDISYIDGRWFARTAPYFEESFDCPSLSKLVKAVQHMWAADSLIFVVDQSTVEGDLNAEAQFVNARGSKEMIIISSEDL